MISIISFLIIGFIILIKGADLLVDGSSSIAKRFGISSLVIGLTIVAFGTSAPELIVNIFSSISGNTELAIGNILGSNIANILLILGVAAMIFPLSVKKSTVWKEIPFAFLAVVLVAIMASDGFIDGGQFSGLTKIDGLVLIGFFIIFLYYTFGISRVQESDKEEVPIHRYSTSKSFFMVVIGLIGLTLGGKWIVDSAVALATVFGVSKALIGLTIVAVGTSLPELATSAVAAFKKDVDIAVGNIVGSNIFNVFWILGLSSVISPLPFTSDLAIDSLVAIVAAGLLFVIMFIGKRHVIERWQGFLFIVLYVVYILYLISRG